MPPTQEQEKTQLPSGRTETVDQTVSRARAMVEPTVSADQLESPQRLPNAPEPQRGTLPQNQGTVRAVVEDIRNTSQQARELEQQQQEFGGLMDDQTGFDIQEEQLQKFGVTPDRLQKLSDIEMQLAEMDTASDLTKTRIQGAAGQTMATAQREVTQEDRENAVRTAGLASQAAVLRGNIETGRQLARDAVNIAYQDKQFQAQNMIQQIDWLQQNVNQEISAGLEDERRKHERTINEINRAQQSVDFVVSNGMARPEEIEQLLSVGSPRKQTAMAQKIANRGAARERGLKLEQLALSVAKSRQAVEGLGKPDANSMLIQSLFSEGKPDKSFQEFLRDRGMANISLTKDAQAGLEEEYRQTFATNPQQKQETISYLVATGVIKPSQAEFLQTNLDFTTPQQKAKQEASIRRGKTVLRDVDRALELADTSGRLSGYLAEGTRWFGSGPSLTARMSPAFELQQHLQSMKSNISIDELQAMREASPTGGALGQVPVQQQEFLMSVLGSLNPSLPSDVLEENLNDVYNVYLDTMFGSPQELSTAVKRGKMTPTEANSYLQQRKETAFDEYNLPTVKSQGESIENYVIAPNGELVIIE